MYGKNKHHNDLYPGVSNRLLGTSLTHTFKTIWLFTVNDLKSIVLPESGFGIFGALSGSLLTTNPSPNLIDIFLRIPNIILWNWLNLLIFDIANQRLEASIIEDSVNKPWRPIPSKKLSATQARRLLLWAIPCVFLATCYLGGMQECVAMFVLTWMYNDLGGADEHYLERNMINALGFICYGSGSTAVAAGYGSWKLNQRANTWLAITGGIVFSTLQMQDMADVEGDRARGRKTLPLVHGQLVARLSIFLPVLLWSFICPLYWQVDTWAYLLPVTAGLMLGIRVLLLRSTMADRVTWKLWCVWVTTLYALPVCKDYSIFSRFAEDFQRYWRNND